MLMAVEKVKRKLVFVKDLRNTPFVSREKTKTMKIDEEVIL
jgi:hypothetical protein